MFRRINVRVKSYLSCGLSGPLRNVDAQLQAVTRSFFYECPASVQKPGDHEELLFRSIPNEDYLHEV
jgi:hypothetical protein